jgi:N-methylhydantoinase A/oxoprolinase/acetone carboxylase beta subunit
MTFSNLRIGIDVGGTHTDAVVLDTSDNLLSKVKVATTSDVTTGIDNAIRSVLEASIDKSRISHVMIGTTHATNALLEMRGLRKVAVIRVGAPSTNSIRPLFGWPEELRKAVSIGECIVGGGAELDGTEIVEFDADAVARFLASLPQPVEAVAITAVFSPVTAEHEMLAEQVVRRELGGKVHVSLSHEIGSLGLLERENATVLNEALVGAAQGVVGSLTSVLEANGLGSAVVFFAQNDGTLMALDYAMNFPVLTIGSGPANSIRGAAHLTGVKEALVIDVGGTSTDIGVLVNGFPRESTFGVQIGGISTNFRMPDLVSIAIGGGSIIRERNGEINVGPDSVGYQLSREALIFGGSQLTLSDASVSAGRASFGTKTIDPKYSETLGIGLAASDRAIADGIDRVKTMRGEMPLIAVGGGSVLLADRMPGISEILRPDNYDVANAIGAAIGTVSGQLDRIFPMDRTSRSEVITQACDQAKEQAVRAGADPNLVEIIDIEEVPLSYLSNPAMRVRVKAAGPLGSL